MKTKKRAPEPLPDLSSVTAIRAAFQQRTPSADDQYEEVEAFGHFIRAAIPAVLGAEPAVAPRAFSSWSPEQRAFLEETAKVPESLHINAGTVGRMLEAVGAILFAGPEDDCYLRRYVGLTAPSVLESEVQDRPLWLWLRLCLMGTIDRDAFLNSFAHLDEASRIELAKRASDNAYQLMRRWPLPAAITSELEREDATQLYELLLPILEPLSAKARSAAIADAAGQETAQPELVLLLSIGQASHGEPLTANSESLMSALELYTNSTIGLRFLSLLPASQRREVIESIQLAPHNLDGWAYLDLLEPDDKQRVVLATLAGFKRPMKGTVAARVRELIHTFDETARGELRALSAKGGPNAKVIDAALDEQS